jgi:hypothetical protein
VLQGQKVLSTLKSSVVPGIPGQMAGPTPLPEQKLSLPWYHLRGLSLGYLARILHIPSQKMCHRLSSQEAAYCKHTESRWDGMLGYKISLSDLMVKKRGFGNEWI